MVLFICLDQVNDILAALGGAEREGAVPAAIFPYLHPSHLLEPCNGVADGVHTHVAHVQLAGRIREHGQYVKLGL